MTYSVTYNEEKMNRSPVQEHHLDNGLTVLTREVRVAPIVSFWVWYRVGSRNETPGITGISHWAEHMVFKGTKRFPKGETDKLVATHGGTRNGFTWVDYTAYYETMPSEHTAIAVGIEADRMGNSTFDPDEVASERGVIISEREGNENHPGFYLGEELAGGGVQGPSLRASGGGLQVRPAGDHPGGPLEPLPALLRPQ